MPGVYIRSMATRGHLGGLALATPRAARVLDAAGKPWIIVETVGVGQVEVDIAGAADTTVVVVNPGWGDGVQANKAGLMEIADLFVVNKADRDGVAETVRDLELMLDLSGHTEWRPKIVTTVATRGEGIDELWDAIGEHRRSRMRTAASNAGARRACATSCGRSCARGSRRRWPTRAGATRSRSWSAAGRAPGARPARGRGRAAHRPRLRPDGGMR